jgi:YD repeat-containing protein
VSGEQGGGRASTPVTFVSFTHDAAGRPTSRQSPGTLASLAYDARDMLTSIDRGAGATTTLVPAMSHGSAPTPAACAATSPP